MAPVAANLYNSSVQNLGAAAGHYGADIVRDLSEVAFSLKRATRLSGPHRPILLRSAGGEAKIKLPVCSLESFKIVFDCRVRFVIRKAHYRYSALRISGELGEKLTVECSHLAGRAGHLAGGALISIARWHSSLSPHLNALIRYWSDLISSSAHLHEYSAE
jgi:hypothetical protein